MSGWQNKPTDLRAARRRTERTLVLSVAGILVIGGSVLIGLLYGWPSALSALLCLAPGGVVMVLLWLLLRFLEALSRRDE
jgi:hypothetical protein